MGGLVVNLKGDPVVNYLTGEARESQTILLDPFDFYDEAGNLLPVQISNIYAADEPALREGAERGSGEGCWVIVEFAEDIGPCTAVVQRTTLRTDHVFAEASAELKK